MMSIQLLLGRQAAERHVAVEPRERLVVGQDVLGGHVAGAAAARESAEGGSSQPQSRTSGAGIETAGFADLPATHDATRFNPAAAKRHDIVWGLT